MIGFELQIYGIGNDRSDNSATTTARQRYNATYPITSSVADHGIRSTYTCSCVQKSFLGLFRKYYNFRQKIVSPVMRDER